MEKDEIVSYWAESSGQDYKVVESLFAAGHYTWALFVGHLVIEKLLKAYYSKNVDMNIPRTHNLTKLADAAGLSLDDERRLFLEKVTTFNLEGRYPDQKLRFHKMATKDFTERHIAGIKEVRQWLLQLIKS